MAVFMEGRLGVAALSIEGRAQVKMEGERAEMREAAKVAAHEVEQLRLRLEKETGELVLRERHAAKERDELEVRAHTNGLLPLSQHLAVCRAQQRQAG